MAESAPVTETVHSPNGTVVTLPDEVAVHRADLTSAVFTPRQLRAIRETYGRSWGQIMGDEESDEKLELIAWLKLQDALGPFPLEAMADVKIRLDLEGGAADPTETANSSSSSDSAAGGGSPPATSTS